MKFRFNRKEDKSLTISSTISQTISTISFKTTTTKFSISRSVTFSERSRNSSISLVIFATIASTTSKRSHFSLFTFKFTSKFAKTASTTCSFSISLASSSLFRKSISKFHFTIDDLIRMFREKFNSFDLSQHQKRRFFSRSSDIFYQSRIIAYFLSAINQKTSISQNLKSSNSKNFQQSMFAKSLSFCRFVLLTYLSEKSIFSSYKKSDFFYISLQSKFSTRFSFLQSRFSFA